MAVNFCLGLLEQGAGERQELGFSSQPREAETGRVLSAELLAGFGRGQVEGQVVDSSLVPGGASLRVEGCWRRGGDMLHEDKMAGCYVTLRQDGRLLCYMKTKLLADM